VADFNQSKGEQEIWMTEPTCRLLALEQADLPYLSHILSLPPGQPHQLAGVVLTLMPSGRMIGSAQVRVELPDGLTKVTGD
jgi:Cft2 family RNA processing exonuclease